MISQQYNWIKLSWGIGDTISTSELEERKKALHPHADFQHILGFSQV